VELGPLNTAPAIAARRRRRRVALAVLLAATAIGVFRPRPTRTGSGDAADPAAAPAERPARLVPDSVRIKVEVINATSTRGLGRLATAWLRDQGFDVVGTGTAASAERRDTTLVLDRSGHADWAMLAAKAMGGATLRYVDLTVLIGRSWRPPAQSLYP
jgi:hypothetical protein